MEENSRNTAASSCTLSRRRFNWYGDFRNNYKFNNIFCIVSSILHWGLVIGPERPFAIRSPYRGRLSPNRLSEHGPITIPQDNCSFAYYIKQILFIDAGVPLEECPRSQQPGCEKIPLLVQVCCSVVEERGLEIVGIYRVPGNSAAVNYLTEQVSIHTETPILDSLSVLTHLSFLLRSTEYLFVKLFSKLFCDIILSL